MGRILIVAIAVFLVVSSCKKKNEEAPTEIVIDKTELKLMGIPNAEDSFKITTNRPWIIKVEPAADWLQLSAKIGEGDMWVKIKNTANATQASSVTLTVVDASERVAEKKITINRMLFKTFGGSKLDYFSKGCATSDGGFIVVGHTTSYDGDLGFRTGTQNNFSDGLVVKYSSTGEVQWKKTYGGSQDDVLKAVLQTPAGDFILAGLSKSADGDLPGNHGSEDVWVIKVDANGGKEWSRFFGGSAIEYVGDLIWAGDGGVLVLGGSSSNDGDLQGEEPKIGLKDSWLIKLKADGNMQWHKVYGNKDMAEFRTGIKTTGGFILGRIAGVSNGALYCNKVDDQGTPIWSKAYTGKEGANVAGIHITSGNEMFVFGNGTELSSPFPTTLGIRDGVIFKNNDAGVIQWAKYIGGSGNDNISGAVNIAGKGYLLAGSSESNDGHLKENKGKTDAWFLLTNDQGEVIWSKTIGGTAEDEFRHAIVLSNKKIVLIGNTNSNDGTITGNHGGQDGFILMFE